MPHHPMSRLRPDAQTSAVARGLVVAAILLATATAYRSSTVIIAQTSLRQRIIEAENARMVSDGAVAPILEGLRGDNATLAAVAARALGRFEHPPFVIHLLPALSHPRMEVRREAANALGQSLATLPRDVSAPPSVELDNVVRALIERIDSDTDPYVRGTIAETLGRLPYRRVDIIGDVEAAMQRHLPDLRDSAGTQPLHPGSLTGVVAGLEALIRLNRARWTPGATTVERLTALAVSTLYRLDEAFITIRRLAWLAVTAAGAADIALTEEGQSDPDAQVRRLALAAMVPAAASTTSQSPARESEEQRAVLNRALADRSFHVRYEAVRVYARLLGAADCAPLIEALGDDNAHVVLGAIDAIGERCTGSQAAAVLAARADQLGDAQAESGSKPPDRWHHPAHAIVALARVDRARANRRLERFAAHSTWQVRAYAARAAAETGEASLLERLFDQDQSENVRYEALQGLRTVQGHEADARFIQALESDDYQLVLAAAQALEGSSMREAAASQLVRAFTRLSAQRRETSRDPRVAIIERLRELGSREQAEDLESCLTDFDPAVARACAATLEHWTSVRYVAQPDPLDREPVSDALPLRARVVMGSGASFEMALLTEDAPASVSRFARLVERNYYDGLTFHRVIPNFIGQGGSPGANEYAGDGPFMRDELGLRSNIRGAVGVSTRGRDTGDAQFYINLLDNPRLDHEYTVFAVVTSGMDVVDGILEGDVISRIEIP